MLFRFRNFQVYKDKAHFLNQALTSLEEVDDRYISLAEMEIVINKGENLGKQLIGFSKSLKSS